MDITNLFYITTSTIHIETTCLIFISSIYYSIRTRYVGLFSRKHYDITMSPSVAVAVACFNNELLKQEVLDIDNYRDMLKQRPSASVGETGAGCNTGKL